MLGAKIKYTCKNCDWNTSIRSEWADLKPRRCMNKKCGVSFLKNPDLLTIQSPIAEKSSVDSLKTKKIISKKNKKESNLENVINKEEGSS